MTDEEFAKGVAYLKAVDPVLASLITRVPPFERATATGDYFFDLTDAIISQQLSIKAAATILKRFVALFPQEKVTPLAVIQMDTEKIRAAGISYAKINYIKDLAQKTEESGILFEQFDIMNDEEIIEELVKVKGIGRWTAEMFLMFTMGRLDIFSYGDLGIRNALKKFYGFENEPTKAEAEKIAEKWKPYRTVACRYLWKGLELQD